MRLTKYSHACVRVEDGGAVLVVDPGTFSERTALDGADAILITHEHVDHVDIEAIGETLASRSSPIQIYTNEAVAKILADLGGIVHTVESGQSFTAAGMKIRAYGAWHAIVHPDVPPVPNLGYLIGDRVYHPGDSFDVPEGASPEVVFVPVTAPWLKAAESIDFTRRVAARRAYALHDCLGSDIGLNLIDGLMGRLSGAEYARLAAGETVEV